MYILINLPTFDTWALNSGYKLRSSGNWQTFEYTALSPSPSPWNMAPLATRVLSPARADRRHNALAQRSHTDMCERQACTFEVNIRTADLLGLSSGMPLICTNSRSFFFCFAEAIGDGIEQKSFLGFSSCLLWYHRPCFFFLRVFKLAIVLNSSSVSCLTSSRCNYAVIRFPWNPRSLLVRFWKTASGTLPKKRFRQELTCALVIPSNIRAAHTLGWTAGEMNNFPRGSPSRCRSLSP